MWPHKITEDLGIAHHYIIEKQGEPKNEKNTLKCYYYFACLMNNTRCIPFLKLDAVSIT